MPPEMCAMPDVITVMSSDCVIFASGYEITSEVAESGTTHITFRR